MLIRFTPHYKIIKSMAVKLTLSSKEILEKVFPGAPRGYDPYQVDEFLDIILRDYNEIESNFLMKKEEIDALNAKVETLKKEKQQLEIELGKYKERFSNIKASDNVTSDNMDLIKKINKYETFIYKMGYNPHTIK